MSIDVNHRELDHGIPATVGAVVVGVTPPVVVGVTAVTPDAKLRIMYL